MAKYFDKSHNKVYINPNFNRLHEPPCHVPNNNVMHVNPKFPHLLSNVQSKVVINKPKIYVNPNFLKINQTPKMNTCETVMVHENARFQEKNDHNLRIAPKIVEREPTQPETVGTVSKSRYSFIRHTKNISVIKASAESNGVATIKISKYKSVSLKHMMQSRINNLRNTSRCTEQKRLQMPLKTNLCPTGSSIRASRYKLVKHLDNNKAKVTATVTKIPRKSIVIRNQTKLKVIKRDKFKKNNIPCPLYRKYGKCLRNIKGRCDFLHDRKHVSICPTFLKGICHNKDCLLSHELTQQKMPTCYFYLQGTCIKEDCPYLHVKLSDKVKLCPDFLKGYCEQGSKCLHRHDNVKRIKIKPNRNKSHETSKIQRIVDTSPIAKNEVTTINSNSKTISNERYYLEKSEPNINDNKYEVIKPTRCKLGNLPSFIQL